MHCLSLLCAAFAASAPAQIQRQHGAHVHGEATLDLALDGSQLSLTLNAPGMSFAGFEHAPHDDAERKTLADTVTALKTPAGWLSLPSEADCRLDSAKVEPHGFGSALAAEQNRHGGDAHPSEHDADADARHEHSDFDADYRYVCAKPAALHAFDLHLFERFPALHTLHVNLALPDRQDSATLAPGETQVRLSP
ncbi:MAG: DUF2796 domain-containing protein [Rudaea sp.]|uniref:DUF2796 domain-containing protein n=1 Tax=Rudaea sp. TaxID=2136325 RepID=UPI0039E60318